jgi:mono/diheme cytochrome c family protein
MLLSIGLFFGRLHPLLVHLPIGILLMGLFLQVLSRWPRFGVSAGVVKAVLLCGALSAVASCVTGYLLSLSGDYDDDLVSWHMWMGIWVAIVSLVVFLMVLRRVGGAIFGVAGVLLLGLIFVTGHLGGSLTHGSDYLSSAFDGADPGDSAMAIRKPIADIREARVYGDVIQPMLQAHCYGCHGPGRQKGKLRLDDSVWIIKGGKDGAVVRPFHAEESEMIKRMLLPVDDEHRMPPKERTPLKESEIVLFQWWVEQGADFSKKVRAFPQPGKIAGYLLALQGDGGGSPLLPEGAVEAAAEKDLDALRAKKVIVLPVAAGSHWLSANFLNAVNIKDADLALLLPLRKQLVWLKLGGQPVGDSGMAVVGQCTGLTVLHLNDTRVTDKGLGALGSLHGLRLLNLVGTGVTPAGVVVLDSLKRLERIYLYRTKCIPADWPSLKRHFPKTVLDSGGYSVPFAARDTVNELRPHSKVKGK